MTLSQAGAAVADITPPIGTEMGGYGRREGGATGILRPLTARALVLSDGSTELAIVVCDLLGVGSDLVAAARHHVEGIPGSNVLVAATHTHGGPAHIRAAQDPAYIDVTARTIAGAVSAARHRLQPVTVKVGTVDISTVGQNRRDPRGPVDTIARVVYFDPVGTLVNFACHATVLEWDNHLLSPDFPGAAVRFIEHALGGTAIYVQGACGDVNPVWARHDGGDVERVGGIIGAAATRLVHEMRPSEQWCINLSWSEHIAVAPVGRTIELDLAVEQRSVHLSRRARAPREEVEREIAELESRPPDRRTRARINELATARLFSTPARREHSVEVQAMRLSSSLGVIGLPGEFFAETGQRLARSCTPNTLVVAGYANAYAGYVPPASAFAAGGYEVGMAQFEPAAEEEIVAAALDSLARVALVPGSA